MDREPIYKAVTRTSLDPDTAMLLRAGASQDPALLPATWHHLTHKGNFLEVLARARYVMLKEVEKQGSREVTKWIKAAKHDPDVCQAVRVRLSDDCREIVTTFVFTNASAALLFKLSLQ